MLTFEIISMRAVENEKKYVAYTLQVRQDPESTENENQGKDADPVVVERRYTHFLDLYNGLKREFPALMNGISFPRKIYFGNFDQNLITTRSEAFESLLKLIASESRMRETAAAIAFFQDPDLVEAKRLMSCGQFDLYTLCLLENNFRLLNKVYTDRSRVVLCALCRIVACGEASNGALAAPVEKWAQLALRRYEAVSDSDLLSMYIPLLRSCMTIWETLGRDRSELVEELNNRRKRGMNVDSVPTLMEAIDNVNIHT